MSTWTKERSRLARLHQTHAPDSSEVQDARRDFAAARLEDHVARVLADAPPLTDEQRDRIAALLRVNPARPQASHADLGLADTSPNTIGDDV